MKQPARYPLAWPAKRPRRKAAARVRGEFSEAAETKGKTKAITLSTACDRLEDQIDRLGGTYPVLSSNVELRMDGRPRADRAPPVDPGICVYFQLKGVPYVLACDTFTDVAQNIAAVANHIDTLRRQERYGVASATEALQAFQALPAPDGPALVPKGPSAHGKRPWRAVLGSQDCVENVEAVYRALAKRSGGDSDTLLELNTARDAAIAELKAGA